MTRELGCAIICAALAAFFFLLAAIGKLIQMLVEMGVFG